jgi:pilus assembly protein Flp/PilA
MQNIVARFVKGEAGATAVEYGMIAAGIALFIVAALNGLGARLSGTFTSVSDLLK